MKTIEERYKCAQEECSNKCPLYHPDAKICLQHWAIKFATEQQEIDDVENGKALLYAVDKTTKRVKKKMIEKACEWLKNKAASFGYAKCEDVWDATYIFDTNALIECFRKVMEE